MPELTLGELTLNYEERWADRLQGGAPLLLVHGAGGSESHWKWVMESLPGCIRAVAVDLPGHGRSSGTVPVSIGASAAVLERFLAGMRMEGPVAVAAHSISGPVALRLALRRSKRVSHLFLLATAAQVRPHPLFLRQVLSGRVDDAFVRAEFSTAVPDERQQLVVDDLRRVRLAQGASDFMNAASCDLSPLLRTMSLPATVVAGRSDVVVSPRRSRALAAQLPGARMLVLEGGHYLHLEQPEEVATAITELVAAADTGRWRCRDDRDRAP